MNPIRIWRSFWSWRRSSPRPSLRQWMQGYRWAVYSEGMFLGFSTAPVVEPQLLDLTIQIPEIREDNSDLMKLFFKGSDT